ncbi:MAG: protein translocase SEC61 complex subunit gamma [Candidatus Aenigmatarchaeota archaeon]
MEEANESKQQEKASHKAKKIDKPKGPGLFTKLKNKIAQFKRVVSIARKPEKEEFISSVKITGTGMALIGVIGFIIFLLYFLVRSL